MEMKTKPSAQRVRALRARTGLKQEPFARLVGASYRSVQRWEKGDTEPRAYQVRAMCAAVGVSESDFAALAVDEDAAALPSIRDEAARAARDEVLSILASLFGALSDAKQAAWDGVERRGSGLLSAKR